MEEAEIEGPGTVRGMGQEKPGNLYGRGKAG